ncbi:MAG: glycoside hydrolase family 3 C-terminal domain-containing protein [Prevotella sp.]|nr:glycoside hydrolase family 3 C-terminal domain-containing protein [Prevotella sp.]MBR3413918.1 glycoside hydrolase family 3 C-terminal domain-containing protein [Bacteroidales bacterium]MBR3414258.1 glycoside hydrolase family 3 C-terminal domain-containing protein [Bacteroidales bacterium]MBR3480772.1 glycoside hydrolase family 3 C-terminal domain-containing protein [Prevotella sp.]
MKKLILTALAATICMVTMNAQPKLSANNIDEVMKAMTLEEKAKLLVGGSNNFFGDQAAVGGEADLVAGAAGTSPAIPRLGIPATVLTDGPAGVRIDPTRKGTTQTYYATGFPIGTCLASTWNTELVGKVGEAIGNETKEYRCDVILGPGMNLHRNPLCGRNFEYYSEDPFLTGKIAAAYINGVQSQGAGVSAKHFAVNSQETERTSVDERVSQRALRELYLRGFEIAVRESNPWTIMASYNKINGEFSMGNRDLLTSILRDDWGFKGIVMTDWIGIRKGLPTITEVQAGNDLMEPGQPAQVKEIVEGVNSGKLSMADVDRNVRRMLEYIVKTPSFNNYPATNKPDLKAHAAITRQTACEGIVLLKNNGTLPWNTKKMVNGQWSMVNVATVALFGENSYNFLSGGVGSGCVHTPYVVDMVEGLKNAGIKSSETLTDIYRKYIDYARLKFQVERHPAKWFQTEAMGPQKYPEIALNTIAINKEVRGADAAIITIGRQAGEGIDRDLETEFNIIPEERQLIIDVCQAFHAAGKPVIVIINSGSVIETASWNSYPDAIVCAWQPGEEGGNSVADILTGKVNPSGRLTMTWPLAATDHPSTHNFPGMVDFYSYQIMRGGGREMPNYDYTNHDEDIFVGYRYFDTFQKEVSYPFGFGLSYTTFDFSQPKAKVNGDNVDVTITVKNTGNVSGKEVVQVYVTAPDGQLQKPAQELKAFAKTRELQPGESQTLTMEIPVRMLASFDEQGSQWLTEAGDYTFRIGSSSRDIKATATAKVGQYTEKVSNALAPNAKLKLLQQ